MNNNFYSKVFAWLFLGLLITFGSGYLVCTSEPIFYAIFSTPLYWILPIAQIAICIFLTARIMKMQATTAKLLYIAYTVLTGLSFASIFLLFDVASIVFVFLATSLIFGLFALLGHFTRFDLTKVGSFVFMALLAVIIMEVINIFLMNSSLDMFLCIISILIFMGYTAYDMQKIKRMKEAGATEDNLAIIGAFELYLDFINLFIDLLRLLNRSRD